MKISEILIEGALSKYDMQPVRTEDLRELILAHCNKFFHHNATTPIYRGRSSDKDRALIINPGSGKRYSENTSGHYNYIIDGHPDYRGWPKRLHSLICATRVSTATAFGTPYVVLPFDDQPIGVVPYADIWGLNIDLSPFTGKYDLYDLDSLNKVIFSRLFPNDTNLSGMMDTASWPEFEEEFADLFPNSTLPASDFMPYILDKFSPQKLGMTLENSSTIDVASLGDREVWFSQPALVIDRNIYMEMLKNF